MQGNNKPPTIHVNPAFKENQKNFIHINPNKQMVNMVIHVNPRIANPFTCAGGQQANVQQQTANKTFPNDTERPEMPSNIQKSVYVNPKLMQKLTRKVPEMKNQVNEEITKIQPKKDTSKFIINKTTIKTDNFHYNKKTLSPNLISLSKRKLVRVRTDNVSNVVPKNLSKVNLKPVVQTPVQKVEVGRIINRDQLKKINDPNRLKKVTANPMKKINTSNLKKVNVSSLKKINVSVKARSPNSKKSSSKYKIDRTAGDESTKIQLATKTRGVNNKNLVKIDGVFYRSSKSKLIKSSSHTNSTTKTNSPVKKCSPSTTRTRKVRRHVVINGKIAKIDTSILSKASLPNPNQKSNYKQVVSNRVKQRSLQILRHKMCKNNQPCLLFQRFGYCAKYIEGTCPKVHDKKQVALCKNFLQGKCHLDNCRLSHDVGPEKMPTCKYFLEGCCTRDNCQYLHVKVSANTPICVPFLRGYCAKGDQCEERHTNICPEFDKYGKCEKGKNCPYPHKSNLLLQKNPMRLKKPLKQYKNQKEDETKSVDISSQDDNKRRYYDEDCTSQNLEEKKCKIDKQIEIIKKIHNPTLLESKLPDITDQAEMKSQPISDNNRPRRTPIGNLPSYIPIN